MANYAYLKADKSDLEQQKETIAKFANANSLSIDEFIIDKGQNKKNWEDLGIGPIVKNIKSGDCIITIGGPELATSTLQVLEILSKLTAAKASI